MMRRNSRELLGLVQDVLGCLLFLLLIVLIMALMAALQP